MPFNSIFSKAVLIDIEVCKWTGEKQLKPEDLGINGKTLPKAFKLGRKSLVDPTILKKIVHEENRARRLLLRLSYPFPMGNFSYVPKQAVEEFVTEFEDIKQKFMATVRDLIDNFDKYKLEMRGDFLKAAKTAYERLVKADHAAIHEKDEKGNPTEIIISESQFVNRFLDRIEQAYPTVEAIEKKYDMSYFAFQMELPDLCEATIDDIAEEEEKAQLIREGFQSRKTKELCKQMMTDIREYAGNIVKENRDRATSVLINIRDNLSGGKKFSEASHRMVVNAIDRFVKLNIADDKTLEENLVAFKKNYLDNFDAKTIRKSPEIKQAMLEEISSLLNIAENKEAVDALALAYRKNIGLNGDSQPVQQSVAA